MKIIIKNIELLGIYMQNILKVNRIDNNNNKTDVSCVLG